MDMDGVLEHFEMFFSDIRYDRESGSSELTERLLFKMSEFLKMCDYFDTEFFERFIEFLQGIRPDMAMIKNTVAKIVSFYKEGRTRGEISKHQIVSFIYDIINYLKEKRRIIIEKGVDILSPYQSIAVVSYSSLVRDIISGLGGVKLIILEVDMHALRLARTFGSFEICPPEKLCVMADVGVMGADAIIMHEEKVSFIINGIPSGLFVKSMGEKPIYIFAEREKIISGDLQISEKENFEKISFVPNMNFVLL